MMIQLALPIKRQTIMNYLPHRDPMLFVDEVMEYCSDSIEVISEICRERPAFQGHFPGNPIWPGVLIVETAAQAGALLVTLRGDISRQHFMALTRIEQVRLKKPVLPGDRLRVRVKIDKIRRIFYKFNALAFVGKHEVARLEFSAARMVSGIHSEY